MTGKSSLFAIAGLSAQSEVAYLFVVRRGPTLAADVAGQLRTDVAEAARVLEDLRRRGLVARANATDDAYVPVDPRVALSALADRLSGQVRRIREEIPALGDEFERSVVDHAGTARTRIVTDRTEIARWYVRIQHQAKRELASFDRPPYVSLPLEPLASGILDRGVSWRAIYTPESFSRQGGWDETLRLAEQGEQARIVSALPMKLVLADRSIALLSLRLDGVGHDALVTEAPPLVAMLHEVFETTWSRALPLDSSAAGGAGPATGRHGGPTREQRAILALIGAGLTDEAIATRLGLSVRSLRRRSQQLMAELGAENRFQLGVEAARRGWV